MRDTGGVRVKSRPGKTRYVRRGEMRARGTEMWRSGTSIEMWCGAEMWCSAEMRRATTNTRSSSAAAAAATEMACASTTRMTAATAGMSTAASAAWFCGQSRAGGRA